MAINVDVARAGAPLLNLRGVTDVRQPAAASQAKDDGMLGNLLAGSTAPMTQQQKMRRDIGTLFGVDTRSVDEKVRSALLDSGISPESSAGYNMAAQLYAQEGATAKALKAQMLADAKKREEQEKSAQAMNITNLQNSIVNQASAAGVPELGEAVKYITDPAKLQEIALKIAEGKEDKIVSKGAGIWDGEKYIMPPTQEEEPPISYQKVGNSVLVFKGVDLIGEYGASAEADPKAAAEEASTMHSNLMSQLASTDTVISTIDKAIAEAGFWTTGKVGAIIAATDIGKAGTGRLDLETYINTIQANLGFDELQKMRDNSPTGGALGQVAVRELEMLQSTIASLNPDLDSDVLKEQLREVQRHYENYKNLLLGNPATNINWEDPSYSGSTQVLNGMRYLKDANSDWFLLGPAQ